ncbi:unnamed protein product [Arctogadus glacialis]
MIRKGSRCPHPPPVSPDAPTGTPAGRSSSSILRVLQGHLLLLLINLPAILPIRPSNRWLCDFAPNNSLLLRLQSTAVWKSLIILGSCLDKNKGMPDRQPNPPLTKESSEGNNALKQISGHVPKTMYQSMYIPNTLCIGQ